jgi:hypothetical protein
MTIIFKSHQQNLNNFNLSLQRNMKGRIKLVIKKAIKRVDNAIVRKKQRKSYEKIILNSILNHLHFIS